MASVADVSVVILTLNEERNVPHAIDSVNGWATDVFVLDSGSADRTCEIALGKGCRVHKNAFVNYSEQRNYALRQLPISTEWVFFLDADEWLGADLKGEIDAKLASRPAENGFLVRFKLIWMGRWIRHGYFSTWLLRLVRRSKAACDDRGINEHLIVEGAVGRLDNAFVHEDRNGLGAWARKHVKYAEMEGQRLRAIASSRGRQGALFGGQADRTLWIRANIWSLLPPVVRPWLYFSYRYFLRGGFVDGMPGFLFHFMQALWFQTLIDAIYLDERRGRSGADSPTKKD